MDFRTSQYTLVHSSFLSLPEDEPLAPCPDLNCTYPYGPTCDSCQAQIDFNENAPEEAIPYEEPNTKVEEWISSIRTGPSVCEVEKGIKGRRSVGKDYIKIMEEIAEELPTEYQGADREGRDEKAHLEEVGSMVQERRVLPYELPPRSSSLSRSVSTRSSSKRKVHISSRTHVWLEDLFTQTLASQLRDSIFVGGADEVGSEEERCPLCGNEVGDLNFQHVVKCRFAREEREREEEMLLARFKEL